MDKRCKQYIYSSMVVLCLGLSACAEKTPEHSQVSEQPPVATQFANQPMPQHSLLSTRIRFAYADLAALASEEIPATHTDVGKQKICKKVIGLKLCGTAHWEYTVLREDAVQVSGQDDFVIISVPMRFFGKAGIGGDVAKVLNLDAMGFAGAMLAKLRLKIDLTEQWCPIIKTEASYQWTKAPKLDWAGVDIKLQDKVDKAIAKQLSGLENKIANAIDCDQFRESVQAQWKPHSIALDLADNAHMFLNIQPTGFSFSGIRTEATKLGLAFTLNANTSLQNSALEPITLPLPPLSMTAYQPGSTQFNVLVRAPYSQLQTLAEEQLLGKTYSQRSAAGDVSVNISSITLSGNPEGITLNLGFSANLPGKKRATEGNLYLTATPILDAFTQTVRLNNIALSNVLDSRLWNTLAAVFNTKIITELENKAVLDLAPKLANVTSKLETQLADPERTAGLRIAEPSINVFLESLVPEQDNLAAVLRIETQLDIDVPVNALYQQHAKR